jgi:sulfur-oxidizing protein SoxA
MRRQRAVRCAAWLASVVVSAAAAAADERRSGVEFMTPALQALQRDDTRNPAMLWVREGQALWARPAPNGQSCAGCHADDAWKSAAARHPAYDVGLARPLTLAGRIDRCRQQHLQRPGEGPEGPEVLALSAWLAHQARGRPLAPPADARLEPWRAQGEGLWRRRFGQLNLSCAQCHDDRAGQRLGGAVIPQAHPTGYPTYRLEWQTLGSLQRRLRGCLVGVRAEPFPPGAGEWVALEVYLVQRAAGMALEGVAVRP